MWIQDDFQDKWNMSLADELLADFEDDDLGQNVEDEAMDDIVEVEDVIPEVDYSNKESVKHIAKLRDGPDLARIMTEVKKYAGQPRRQKGKFISHATRIIFFLGE